MDNVNTFGIKPEAQNAPSLLTATSNPSLNSAQAQSKRHNKRKDSNEDPNKRRCVSSACVACRKRKSKCDGNTPACAACSQVYKTECVYDPGSDHRRKGVYKQDIDKLQTRNSTLTTLVEAILNYPQEDVPELVRQIRTCESLDQVADSISSHDREQSPEEIVDQLTQIGSTSDPTSSFESRLLTRLGQLRLDNEGTTRYYGGTSNLLYMDEFEGFSPQSESSLPIQTTGNPITSWTSVSSDPDLITHLLNMYFCWHYTFFVTLSKAAFDKHFFLGKPSTASGRKLEYCTSLLVNAMLALGCHFSTRRDARANPDDPATAGDHFFREAKRLLMEEEEYEHPRLATVQALGLMSVREAGCGREARGWTYSGIAFRMACDLGLNLDSRGLSSAMASADEEEEDARRMAFWGCFLFDKCWSNYLGRLPFFQLGQNITVPRFEVFPEEEAETWSPYTDVAGYGSAHSQPTRLRAVALHLSDLCAISSDLMTYFYHPEQNSRKIGIQLEIKRLSEIHRRLEDWRRELPVEFEPKEGALPSVFTMHMFFHLLYIHLFRYFLRYDPNDPSLPPNVSPRRNCTQAAGMISRLLRLYKRSYGVRQVCNIVVYFLHSACTIHLLNLPDKTAKRDILHGVRQLEEIAEGWLVARRTLCALATQAKSWNIEIPEEAAMILTRFDEIYGRSSQAEHSDSPRSSPSGTCTVGGESDCMQQNQSNWTLEDQMQDYENKAKQTAWMIPNASTTTTPSQSYAPFVQDDHDFSQKSLVDSGGMPLGFNNHSLGSTSDSTQVYLATGAQSGMVQPVPGFGGSEYHPMQQIYNIPQQTQPPATNEQMRQFLELQRERQILLNRSTKDAPHASTGPMYSMSVPYANLSHQQEPDALGASQVSSTELSSHQKTQSEHAQRPQNPTAATGGSQAANKGSTSRSNSRVPGATSEMFGGVEDLLRENQSWWVDDQGQIANGFERWETDE